MDQNERQQLARQHAAVQRLADELSKISNERAREKDVQAMDKLRDLVVSLYREGSAYTNLIIVAGYAGAFAIWHFMETSISQDVRISSALALLISVLCFVSFEVQKMIKEGMRLRGLGEAMLTLPEEKRLETLLALLNKGQLAQTRIWLFFLIPTIAAASVAAALLLCSFVAKLFGYQFLP